MTRHCLSEASSSIFPSSITAPRPVTHRRLDASRVRDIGHGGREDLLRDRDLHRVQRPGAHTTKEEGVAELVLARDDILDVPERSVVGEIPCIAQASTMRAIV